MDENHPVCTALMLKLDALRRHYQIEPNEQSRYQLVRMERLIAEWVPGSLVLA